MANNKPRGKGRHNCQVKTKEFYQTYLEDTDNAVDRATFGNVLNDINDSISKAIIRENYDFRVPYRLGYIRIKKFKNYFDKKYLKPDWKKTNELWDKDPKAKKEKKLVYHFNEHTENYYFRFYYTKFTCNIKNKSVYSFKPTRDNARFLSNYIRANPEMDYYE